jgi:hypothetical protein
MTCIYSKCILVGSAIALGLSTQLALVDGLPLNPSVRHL